MIDKIKLIITLDVGKTTYIINFIQDVLLKIKPLGSIKILKTLICFESEC